MWVTTKNVPITKPKTNMMHIAEITNAKVKSEALFQKLRELVIVHEDQEYRLRITSNNKLILTK